MCTACLHACACTCTNNNWPESMKLLFSNFDSNLTIYRVCIQFVRSKKRQMFTIPPAQWMVCFVWHGKLSTAIKNWMQCTNWQQRFNTAITVHKWHTHILAHAHAHTYCQESNENAGLNLSFDSSVLLSSSKINDFKLALNASLNCPAAAVVIYWLKENIALLCFGLNIINQFLEIKDFFRHQI